VRHVIADVETDGLLDRLTTIHSLVLRDLEHPDTIVSCANQPGYTPIADGLRMLQAAERIYFHNGIRFDIPAILKVYPEWTFQREQVRDTFIIASMRFAHIRDTDYRRANAGRYPKHLAGSHSLEAWGYRLGVYKGEYTDWCKANGISDPWSSWRKEMQTYCEEDTATTLALVQKLQQTVISTESIEIEHELAWYLAAQERAGVPFDMEKAQALQAVLSAKREGLAQQLRAEFGPILVKSGAVTVPKKDNKKRHVTAGAAYQNLKRVEFNPGSRRHIEVKLKALFGWEPTEFTDGGQAQVNEKTLGNLNAEIPAVKSLMDYLLVCKRLSQMAEGKKGEDTAWMKLATADGPAGGRITGCYHIHGRVKQNHAITHRAAHAKPNMSAIPKVGKPYGEECRELFYVPQSPRVAEDDQWRLVGADLAGLEARNLGHYMARFDGGAFAKVLLEGDVHTANRIALGLPGDDDSMAKVARGGAKNWFYAFMYGGGDFKLGSMLMSIAMPDGKRLLPAPAGGWTEARIKTLGKQRKQQFLKNTPALKALIDTVQAAAKAKGYLVLPDGRRAFIRSEHAALNTLLQGAGAIIAKRWIVNAARRYQQELGTPGWDARWVPLLWSHDETQHGVRKVHAEWACQMLVEECRKLTEHYQWRVPLDGEAKIGLNWKMTH
jgi:DNA polymerase-1